MLCEVKRCRVCKKIAKYVKYQHVVKGKIVNFLSDHKMSNFYNIETCKKIEDRNKKVLVVFFN